MKVSGPVCISLGANLAREFRNGFAEATEKYCKLKNPLLASKKDLDALIVNLPGALDGE